MKEKWKNLRDTYKKHKKSLKTSSGQAAKKLKNWVWAAQMQFLDGSITMRTTEDTPLNSSSISTPTNNSSGSISFISTATQNSTCTSTPTQIPSTPTTAQNIDAVVSSHLTEESTQQEDIGNSRRKRRNQDPSDKIIDYLKSKSSKRNEGQKLDKTDYLFLNYADTFKSFTPRRQAMVKLDLAKLFTEAELANMDEVDTHPRSAASNYSTNTPTYSVISDYSDASQLIQLRISNDNLNDNNTGQIASLSMPSLDTDIDSEQIMNLSKTTLDSSSELCENDTNSINMN